MPNLKSVKRDNKNDKQRASLATEIGALLDQLTYGEKLAVCLAAGKHEVTLDRYRSEVKKIPTALKMIAEMKKVLALREVAPVS